MLRVALIGCGTISGAHIPAYYALENAGRDIRLVAACDIRPEQKAKLRSALVSEERSNEIRFYTDFKEMLDKEEVDMVDICLPTFLHREVAVHALERGYHVLCEKPMALTDEDCRAMLKAAERAEGRLMIAQCVRFFNPILYLKEALEDGRFGKPLSACFRRLSPPPMGWQGWFRDFSLSGSCLTDLSIHDIDAMRYLFGEPKGFHATASTKLYKRDAVQVNFEYDGMAVTVIGSEQFDKVPFSSDGFVCFEHATVLCHPDLSVTVYPEEGESFKPAFDSLTGYAREIDYFRGLIASGEENKKCPPEDSQKTIALINQIHASLD